MNRQYIERVRLSSPIERSSYLCELPVIRYLERAGGLTFSKNVTFLVGENGTGKSTLLEAIAMAAGFNAEGGSRHYHFATSDTHSELFQHLTLSRAAHPRDGFFLRAESFYNAASYLNALDGISAVSPKLMDAYGGKSLHEQSHGESFLALIRNRFRGNGLYLLDEPEAALSPTRLLSLLVCIHDLVGDHSQFIIATHSPILMAYPGAEVLELSESGIESVDYRQTAHYQLTLRFLVNPDKMLRQLFEGDAVSDDF